MEPIHLVTGATGFLGSALVLELLRESSGSVLCLARPANDRARARARVQAALERAAAAAQLGHVLERAHGRWRVLAGDLLEPGCGIPAPLLGPVDCVWHIAASLRFEPELEPEILRHNVEGTRNVLELARLAGTREFNYMSTAYVAGARRGRILEELPDLDVPVHNAYEKSKIRAEHLVASSGLAYRIFRPSIVIGYSKTGSAAGSDSGFYGYVKRLARMTRVLKRRGRPGALADTYLPGDPDAQLDLIPVDAVIHNAVAIVRARAPQRIFHLTNASPPSVGAVARTLSDRLGTGGPRFRAGGRAEGPYADTLEDWMRFFLSYVSGGKTFDRSHTDAAIGAEASLWPLDAGGIQRFVDRYLEEMRGPGRG